MRKEIASSPWATVTELVVGEARYLSMETARASSVLLLAHRTPGGVWLMRQRREDAGDGWFFKTIGGYNKPDEGDEECLKRNLLMKVGIAALRFRECGVTLGYGEVIKVPITLYVCKPQDWYLAGPAKEGCELVQLSEEAVRNLLTKETWAIYDDTTQIQLLQFLARIR